MRRDELLQKAKQVSFCATPTTLTMDMGIEYDYITPDGVGSGFATMGEWPAYKLRSFDAAKWDAMRKNLFEKKLCATDLAGTDLEYLMRHVNEVYGKFLGDFTSTFENLQQLSEISPEYIYCMWDVHVDGERPRFFENLESFLTAFQEKYCEDVYPWEEMGDDEIKMWLERLKTDLVDFPFTVFGEEEWI